MRSLTGSETLATLIELLLDSVMRNSGLGLGLLSKIGDLINRFRGHAGQLQFSGTPATGFLGRLGG